MPTNEASLILAQQTIGQCIALANAYFACSFTQPDCLLNQRGKIAGSAHLQKNLIKLNRVLFTQNHQAFIEQVIPHEVAHIVVFQRFGRTKPHGAEWQHVMCRIFDLAPTVTHQFDVKDVAQKGVEYHCDCGPLTLSLIRHNRVIKHQQQYRCRRCAQVLVQALGSE